MAVSLDPALLAAQNGTAHRPIVKIVSGSMGSDIPFDGQLFNDGTDDEANPALAVLASGRLAATFVRAGDLYLMYSDAGRISWSEALIVDISALASGYAVEDAALIELASGSLGVVFVARSSTYDRLYCMIVGPTGTVVTSAAQIAQHTRTSVQINAPALCETAGGFLCVYRYLNTAASPDTYHLYRRTADANFANWSTGSEVSLSGLVSAREKHHPALLKAASGSIYLFFDYVDDAAGANLRRNIFHVYSTDNGGTWSAPAALTTYGDFTAGAVSPYAAEKSTGDIIVAFNEQISVLTIDHHSTGWCSDSEQMFSQIFYDEAAEKLYAVCSRLSSGGKQLLRVLVVDVPSWSIEKCYRQDGSPGWNSYFNMASVSWYGSSCQGGFLAIPASAGFYTSAVLLINDNTETVTQYFFRSSAEYAITKNIDWGDDEDPYQGLACQLDTANDRLYVCFPYYVGASYNRIRTGYIDLTESPDPITGMYQFNIITTYQENLDGCYLSPPGIAPTYFRMFPSEGLYAVCVRNTASNWKGRLWVFNLSTGSLHKRYDNADNAGFHYRGIASPVIKNGIVYGDTVYEPGYGQSERRGLQIINMTTNAVTYERPTYASLDNYGLMDLKLIDNGARILMGSLSGVAVYDIASKTWTLYNGENVQGFHDDSVWTVAYDELNEIIFSAHGDDYSGNGDLFAFAEGGSMYRGKYIIGTVSGSAYGFAAAADLHLNAGGRDLAVAYDADNILWNVWSNADGGEQSLMWDRDSFAPDLSDFIAAGSAAAVEWEIGKIARAEFTLARGDLFDPANSMSICAPVVRKGRVVEIFFGEKVGDSEYWQPQGKFVITGVQLNISKTGHPTSTVSCEDKSAMWHDLMVTATQGYTNEPLENVLADLLEDFAGLTSADYDIPALANAHGIYMQWVDDDLAAILEDICSHFGVFQHWGVDGVWTLKQIDLGAAVAHDYSAAASKIINFSPDDRFSSFINRVTVRAESQGFLEVLWDEERVGAKSGTVGFWTKDETHRIYYSADRTRRCRYPRMDVIASINDYSPFIKLLGGNGSEEISAEAPDETWLEVAIEAPDRAMYALALAVSVVGVGYAAVSCSFYCGPYILATNLLLSALIQVLTAVANYSYDFYARPIGHEKQTVQATADDTAFQNQLNGLVVPQEFDDPLCYTVRHCQMVADHELAVVRAQRSRAAFTKPAHLQDEIGDIIKIKHPISGLPISLLIAKLRRRFIRPAAGAAGEFTDSIDGWKL